MIEDISSIRGLNDLRLFYFKYKDSPQFVLVLVVVIGLISIAILGKYVLPQLENWATLQSKVKDTQAEIKTLEANQRVVLGLSTKALSSDFDIVTKALPYEKDYAGIVSAIDLATIESGVIRDDYTFSVGNLSTQSAKLSKNQSISFQLSVEGDIEEIKNFLNIIKEKLPLSEIVSFDYQSEKVDMNIIFFYRSLPRDLKIVYLSPINSLNEQNQALLKTLSKWKEGSPEATPVVGEEDSASQSADIITGL